MSKPDIVDRLDNWADGDRDTSRLITEAKAEILRLRSSASEMRERAAGVADKAKEGVDFGDYDTGWSDACDHIAAAIRSLPDEGDGWRTIDSAPKDGTHVILGNSETDDKPAYAAVGWWKEAEADGPDCMGSDAGFVDFEFNTYMPSRSCGAPSHQYRGSQPTHWRPLPPPPRDAT